MSYTNQLIHPDSLGDNHKNQLQQSPSLPTSFTQEKLTLEALVERINLVQNAMKDVMIKDCDYTTLPGTNKPTLLKSGAEKLTQLFNLRPRFKTRIDDLSDNHIRVIVKCYLYHIKTKECWGSADAICSSLEGKYRWRKASRSCPECGSEAIIKGKEEYGGGWICYRQKGGCGAKFPDNDPAILNQEIGRVENQDIADVYNTVVKIAAKRAYIGATLFAVAGSGLFTQDLEDYSESSPTNSQENVQQSNSKTNNTLPTHLEKKRQSLMNDVKAHQISEKSYFHLLEPLKNAKIRKNWENYKTLLNKLESIVKQETAKQQVHANDDDELPF